MYGFTPSAMIENVARPPPENRSSSCRNGLAAMTCVERVLVDARHGHVGEPPHDDQHPQDEEDAAPDVRRAKGVDEGVEHRASVPVAASADPPSSSAGSPAARPRRRRWSSAAVAAAAGSSRRGFSGVRLWSVPPAASILARALAVNASASTNMGTDDLAVAEDLDRHALLGDEPGRAQDLGVDGVGRALP